MTEIDMDYELRRRGLGSAQGDPLRAIDDLLALLHRAHAELTDGPPVPFGRWLLDGGPAEVVHDLELRNLGEAYAAEMLAGQYRVHWLHPTSRDRIVGGEWDRENAEFVAEILGGAGCREVEIHPAGVGS
jgi:hypothetical protein